MQRGRATARLVALALLGLALVMLIAKSARAHGGDTTYLVLTPHGATIDGLVNLDLPDTEGILHVARKDLIEGRSRDVVGAYVLGHLTLTDGAEPCPIELRLDTMKFDLGIQRFHFAFVARCPSAPTKLGVDLEIFFQYAGYYLGMVRVEGPHPDTQLLMSSRRTATFDLDPSTAPVPPPLPARSAPSTGASAPSPTPSATRWTWGAFRSSIGVGVRHIWSGADHMLFLLALLMTSVLERRGGGSGAGKSDGPWAPRESLRACLVDVAKIVTGFTVTHSVTLTLAALGLLRPAPRIIEPAIAASVAIAAIDNLRPFLRGRKWVIASSLGLLHGFGFASALNELRLPEDSLLLTLVGFGLGVEIGQLIFVAVFVPIAFALRATPSYRRWAVPVGSIVIAVVALFWMVQRMAPRGASAVELRSFVVPGAVHAQKSCTGRGGHLPRARPATASSASESIARRGGSAARSSRRRSAFELTPSRAAARAPSRGAPRPPRTPPGRTRPGPCTRPERTSRRGSRPRARCLRPRRARPSSPS